MDAGHHLIPIRVWIELLRTGDPVGVQCRWAFCPHGTNQIHDPGEVFGDLVARLSLIRITLIFLVENRSLDLPRDGSIFEDSEVVVVVNGPNLLELLFELGP